MNHACELCFLGWLAAPVAWVVRWTASRLRPLELHRWNHRALRDACEACHGTSGGVPGNENIVNGRILCDYCHVKESYGKN